MNVQLDCLSLLWVWIFVANVGTEASSSDETTGRTGSNHTTLQPAPPIDRVAVAGACLAIVNEMVSPYAVPRFLPWRWLRPRGV